MKFVIIVHHDGLYPQKFNFGELLRVAGISINHDMIEKKKIQGHFRRSGCKLNVSSKFGDKLRTVHQLNCEILVKKDSSIIVTYILMFSFNIFRLICKPENGYS